eukprot:TRINITY_DN47119_c0_g1_i1.p1 TRINITY_DN47119_c0_g1~~TRINITY_DN47119_c0_g1_i1.p1  ORF type:complete len:409 (+),score=156.70 TRINITY_DN47119_c0_g1_i1:50-1276(+)
MPPKKKQKTESMPAGVSWMYKDDKKWKEYALEDQMMLEKAYGGMRGGEKVMETKKLSFNKEFGSVYKFDFKNWTQLNKDSNNVRKIMRCVEDESDEESKEGSDDESGVQWEVQDNHGMWTPFYDEDNDLIEGAFKKKSKKAFKTTDLTFNKGYDSTYSFDFKDMTQTNEDSGNVRTIRRNLNGKPKAWKVKGYGISGSTGPKPDAPASILAYPDTWEKQKDPMIDLFEVKKGTPEYDNTLVDFFKTLKKKVTVKKLERIQNYALWPFYALNRDKITKANGKHGCNEKMLFHGARVKANMDCIMKYGFDTRVANAGLCGTGTYFAVNATYSDSGYVYRAPDGTKEMFICRVLVGRFALKQGNDRRPPPLDPKKPNDGLYDSVVDNMKSPVMHVVFYDHQAVPEYIVHYM